MTSTEKSLAEILDEARGCTLCAEHLALGPRPVLRASPTARLLIIGQAPGTRVHESGIPWDDPSGQRLRMWMGIPDDKFYDQTQIAIMAMALCYPGRNEKGGDLPPRPECAPIWHPPVLAAMPRLDLTLLVGSYAQARYLPRPKRPVGERVLEFKDFLPEFFPLPHPSWRSTGWLRRNPWFDSEVLPELRRKVQQLLS